MVEEEDGENRGLTNFYITLAMFLGTETLEDHSQLPKKAYKCSIRAVASFSYVWRPIGMSASSLHSDNKVS